MTLTELKSEVEQLQDLERKELLTFLVDLQRFHDRGLLERISEQRDDPDPSRWVKFSEVRESLLR